MKVYLVWYDYWVETCDENSHFEEKVFNIFRDPGDAEDAAKELRKTEKGVYVEERNLL